MNLDSFSNYATHIGTKYINLTRRKKNKKQKTEACKTPNIKDVFNYYDYIPIEIVALLDQQQNTD